MQFFVEKPFFCNVFVVKKVVKEGIIYAIGIEFAEKKLVINNQTERKRQKSV